MKRTTALLTMAALLAIATFPLGLVAPQSARAVAGTITINTVEQGSEGRPPPHTASRI